ncbi:hypothetical protein SAMN04488063_1113 [Halopelagius inordinatus]|uniref:Uncharacterized protein n=1 Tax=Halopelagius inordinatus TaxID=553467 RepID=A0A1I2NHJ9_9EURY|nr:hypothetical protein SAMN04488063_1113 [Halopelagius inordinatus]
MILRDQVWSACLLQLRKTGKFRLSDLPFNEEQHHTVRRVLREMETMDWLARENKRAATWRIGEEAKLHLNVSRDHIKQAWD